MTVQEMVAKFNAYDRETLTFIHRCGWVDMTWTERDAKQAEIDAKHGYKHGWMLTDRGSFNRFDAFPEQSFANAWD
jgi:hypothetical protein